MLSRLGRRTVAAVALAMSLVVFGASGAFALPPNIGGGGTIGGDPGGGGGSGSGGGGGGGGGGTYTPPPPPDGPESRWVSGYRALPLGETVGVVRFSGGGGGVSAECVTLTDGRLPFGFTWTAGVTYPADGGEPRLISGTFRADCAYPPPPVDRVVQCPVSLSGVVSGAYGVATPARTIADTGTVYTPWHRGGRTNPDLCAQAYTLDVNAALTAMGKYQGEVIGRTATCVRRSYPQSAQPDVLLNCRDNPPVTWPFRGAVWCDGYSDNSWPAVDYTIQKCLDENSSAAACDVGNPPRFAGVRGGRSEVLADGRARDVAWDPVRLTGALSNIRGQQTTFQRVGGTPFRTGASANGATQPFLMGHKIGTAYTGDVTGTTLAFQEAGFPNDPFQVNKRMRFTADFTRTTLNLTRLDLATGRMVFTTARVTTTETGTCTSPTVSIDVFRARNAN